MFSGGKWLARPRPGLFDEVMEYLEVTQKPNTASADQWLLNSFFWTRYPDEVNLLPVEWEMLNRLYVAHRGLWARKQPKFVHYCGKKKPWTGGLGARYRAVEKLWHDIYNEKMPVTVSVDLPEEPEENKYGNYLDGKRVCLIGPAKSLIGRKQKELIESYDVVVRMNFGYPVSKELEPYTGGLCDVLYISHGVHLRRYGLLSNMTRFRKVARGVKWIITQRIGSGYDDFATIADGYVFHYHMNEDAKRKIIERLKDTRPNMGFYTIVDLLTYNIEELYITGFDFYTSGYHPGYGVFQSRVYPRSVNWHDQPEHVKVMKEICESDSRVKIDGVLQNVLDGKVEVKEPSRVVVKRQRAAKRRDGKVKMVALKSFRYRSDNIRSGVTYFAEPIDAERHLGNGMAQRAR